MTSKVYPFEDGLKEISRLGRLSIKANQLPQRILSKEKITSATFDDSVLILGLSNGSIEFWHLEFAFLLEERKHAHKTQVELLKTLKHKRLLSVALDEVILWNIPDINNCKGQLSIPIAVYNHTSHVNAIALKNDGSGFISFCTFGTVQWWNFEEPNGQVVQTASKQAECAQCTSISDDDKIALCAYDDGSVHSFSPEVSPSLIFHVAGYLDLYSKPAMQFCPDDWKKLVVGFASGKIHIIDVLQKVILRTVSYHDGICGLFFSPNGSLLVTVSYSFKICTWNFATMTHLNSGKTWHCAPLVAISPDNGIMALSHDNTSVFRHIKQKKDATIKDLYECRHLMLNSKVMFSCFCQSKSVLACFLEDQHFVIIDTNMEMQKDMFEISFQVVCMDFSPDGSILCMVCSENLLHLWRLQSRSEIAVRKLPPGSVQCTFKPDGGIFIATKNCVMHLEPEKDILVKLVTTECAINKTLISPDGNHILINMDSETLVCKSTDMRNPILKIANRQLACCWSTNGEQVACVKSNIVTLANVVTLHTTQINILEYDDIRDIASLAFCPNDAELVASTADSRFFILHVGSGHIVQKVRYHGVVSPHDVFFDHTFRNIVATSSSDKAVLFMTPYRQLSFFGQSRSSYSAPIPPIVFHTTLVDLYIEKKVEQMMELLEKASSKEIHIDWTHPIEFKKPVDSFRGVSLLGYAMFMEDRRTVAAYIKYACTHIPGKWLYHLTSYIPKLLLEFQDLGMEFLGNSKLTYPISYTAVHNCRGYDISDSLVKAPHARCLLGRSSAGVTRATKCVEFYVPFHLAADKNLLHSIVRSDIPVSVWNSFILKCVLTYKWVHYGKYYYRMQMLVYLVYLTCFCLVTIPQFPRTGTYPLSSPWDVGRLVLEIILVGMSLLYLVLEGRQAIMDGLLQYARSPYNLVDLTSLGSVLSMVFMRWGSNHASSYTSAVASVLIWFKLIILSRGFPSTGVFVKMIFAVIKSIKSFLCVLFLMIVAFAHGFYMLEDINKPFSEYGSFAKSLLAQYRMLLGDFDVGDMTSSDPADIIAVIFFCAFTFVVSIVMLNVLIALLSNSYEEVQNNAEAEWLSEIAELLLEIEEVFLTKDKLNSRSYFPKYLTFATPSAAYQAENTQNKPPSDTPSTECSLQSLANQMNILITEVNNLKKSQSCPL